MTRGPSNGIAGISKPRGHHRLAGPWALCLPLLAAAGLHAEEPKVDLKPLQVGASLSFGQMFNIEDSLQEVPNFNPTVTLPYTSLWMIQNGEFNERFSFSLGIAGTFWYPYPEDNGIGWTSYRTGGVAIAVASGSYKLGDLDNPWMEIAVGQQGYKYNPYARNFGEYLFRSEAYPTTVRTGDWGAIDNAGAGIWGAAFKGRFLGGHLTNDFLVTLSNERSPLHDLSFSNVTSVNVGNVLQVGGGVMLSRYLQIDPDKSHPKKANTGYFSWTAADQSQLDAYIKTKQAANPAFLTGNTDFTRKVIENGAQVERPDSVLAPGDYWAASQRPLVKFVSTTGQSDPAFLAASKHDDIEYVDAKTIFLMGRASLDPKPLLGMDASSRDGVLYAEIAVIGLKNYPIYYEKVSERMPLMVGFYVPTFGFLDYLTFEWEQWKNPHMNSDFMPALFRELRPKSPNGTLPVVPDIADPVHDFAQDQYGVNYTDDDIKWTFTASKSFGPWNVAAQYGKDHFRPLTGSFRPSYSPAATTSDASYYMIRLMVNL